LWFHFAERVSHFARVSFSVKPFETVSKISAVANQELRHAICVVEVFLFIDIFFLYSIIETGTLLKK